MARRLRKITFQRNKKTKKYVLKTMTNFVHAMVGKEEFEVGDTVSLVQLKRYIREERFVQVTVKD